jgi:hypothetical protein
LSGSRGRVARPLARILADRARPILLLAVVVALLALGPASEIRIEQDPVALLPEDAPAAADFRAMIEAVGVAEDVYVLLHGAAGVDGDSLALAAELTAESLEPAPEVRAATSGITDEEEEFFLRRVLPAAPLLAADVDAAALRDALAPDAIRRRVARMRSLLAGPQGPQLAPLLAADPLGLAAETELLAAAGPLPVDPASGAFLAEDDRTALVVVTPAADDLDPRSGRSLLALIARAADGARAEVGVAFEVLVVGGPAYAAQDERVLRQDLRATVIGSALLVTLVVLIGFEGWVLPTGAALAVLVGLGWTAGGVGLVAPSLTAAGIGFGAVLIGLGIDYGIHAGTRFREQRAAGEPVRDALANTFEATGPGILASAATTAAGFLVLGLAHFRPVRELGLVVGTGILVIAAASFVVGGSWVSAMHRRPRRPGRVWEAIGQVVDRLVAFGQRWRRSVVAAALVLTLLAGWAATRLELDPDPRRLRPATHPAARAEQLLAEQFGLGLDTTTVLVTGRDRAAALSAAAAAAAELRSRVGERGQIVSPSDWLVDRERAAARLAELEPLGLARAADDLRVALAEAGFAVPRFEPALAVLEQLGAGRVPRHLLAGQPPQRLRRLLRPDGAGWVAAVQVMTPSGLWPAGPPRPLLAALEEIVPGARVASAGRLTAELAELARRDLRRLGLWAVAAMLALVVVSLRGRLRLSLAALAPVVIGTAGALGLWSSLGRPLDLFSIAVVPVVLGIGIDDGLHAAHGALVDPAGGLAGAVRRAGRAMVLTTVTTTAGFGSLALAHVPGLRAGGLLVALGCLLSLAATLIVLPALAGTGRGRAPAGAEWPEAPHAPELGRWRRWLGPVHFTGVFWYRLHTWGARRAPEWLMRGGSRLFAALFLVLLGGVRRAIADNLDVVLGPARPRERWRRAFRTLHTFGWCLGERDEALVGRGRFEWTVEGEPRWHAAEAEGGFIMATAHIGNWEAGSMLPVSRRELRVHLVREPELDPRAQEFVRRQVARVAGGRHVTHFASTDGSLGVALLEALQEGDVVALQADRPRRGGRTIGATMFGQPVALPAGVFALARAADVPVLPVFVLREGRRRYRVVIDEPVRVPRTGDRRADLAQAAGHLARSIESAVRRAPHQWFVFRRLWSTTDAARRGANDSGR